MAKILGLHERSTLEGQSVGQHGTEKSKENLQERLNVTGKKKKSLIGFANKINCKGSRRISELML